MFSGEAKCESVGHFFNDEFGFLIVVGLVKHLSGADTVVFGTIVFDIGNATRFITPSVVDKQFGIDAKKFVEKILVNERATSDVAHGVKTVFGKFSGVTWSNAPKIGDGLV